MPDPVNVPCPADVWTKVATSVSNAIVKIVKTTPNVYLETYRITAAAAPADNSGANPIDASGQLIVSSGELVDIYIQPVRKAGIVRVDT